MSDAKPVPQQQQQQQQQEHHDSSNRSSSNCCECNTNKACFGTAWGVVILFSILFFMVSAVPYLIDFNDRVEEAYSFANLTMLKTIWLRVHVIACSFNLFLGPAQVIVGLLRKAGNSTAHKYLGYTYSLAMVLCVVTSAPLIVLRYLDSDDGGGAWIATPLIALTIYEAVTLFLGIKAIIKGDKPLHRRMLFRNYCGVLVFVTFRIGIVIGGGLNTIFPTVAMLLTFLVAEGFIRKYSASFDDTTPSVTDDADWQSITEDNTDRGDGMATTIQEF